jgi:outer membrane protein
MMKKIALIFGLICMLFAPTTIYAFGIEFAVGAWNQSPSGDIGYEKVPGDDSLDLDEFLNYDDEWQPNGRLIFYLPAFIPNIYLMATPMEWDEPSSLDVSFEVGGKTFQANIPFESKLKMNHLDVGFFWGLPGIKKATSDVLNIDLGLNVRLLDFKTEIKQPQTGLSESESYFLPIPMLYAATQIEPWKYLAVELEGRGIGWGAGHYVSLIGRLKVKPWGPIFVTGGYRYDSVELDYKDIDLDISFTGPFAEAGLEF